MLIIPHHAPHTLNTKTLCYITYHTPSFITCRCSQVLFQIPHRCSQPLWFRWSGIGFSSRVLFIRPEGSVKNHFDNFAIPWQMKQHIPVARSKPIISTSIAAPKCNLGRAPSRQHSFFGPTSLSCALSNSVSDCEKGRLAGQILLLLSNSNCARGGINQCRNSLAGTSIRIVPLSHPFPVSFYF